MIVLIDGGCYISEALVEQVSVLRAAAASRRRHERKPKNSSDKPRNGRSWIMRTGSKRPSALRELPGVPSHSFFLLEKHSDAEGHHPDISFGWGYGTVRAAAHQEDQGSPRERFHHGGKDRSACANGGIAA